MNFFYNLSENTDKVGSDCRQLPASNKIPASSADTNTCDSLRKIKVCLLLHVI